MSWKTVVAGLALIGIWGGTAWASHVPNGTEPLQYDGSAVPGPVTGAVGWTNPTDGYDFFCADVTQGQQVTILLFRTSGDLLLNVCAYQGVVPGGMVSDLSQVTCTSNDTNPDVTLAFTPNFSGPLTLSVSTWLLQNGGTYSMTVVGAAPGTCPGGAAQTAPAMSPLGLVLLVAALAGVAVVMPRQAQRSGV